MKEGQPVKGLKKQNGEVKAVPRNINEGSKSGKKLNPHSHMESQYHLQNAIDYLGKYQKKSIEVGDCEPHSTHTEKYGQNTVKRFAFMNLFEKTIVNKKTQHLWYARLERQLYISSLDPVHARCAFRA